MKRIVLAGAFLTLLLLAAPTPSFAASKPTFLGPIVPEECHCRDQKVEGTGEPIATAPDYGCVLQVVQNVVNFAITLTIIVFTIYLVITAFSFMLGASSGEARSKAKTRFTNLFVGLAVILLSWLIIDYVMKTLYNSDGFFGPWNSILAGKADNSDRCIVAKNPTPVTSGFLDIVFGSSAGTTGGLSGGYSGGKFLYQTPGVAAQEGHVSGALGALLTCMYSKMPSGAGQISAITENAIAQGSKTISQCRGGGCAHSANSCHYGGSACDAHSYAVDFGDENNAAAIRAAVKSCNPNAGYNFEGDHVHVSIGAASNCRCDTSMGKP